MCEAMHEDSGAQAGSRREVTAALARCILGALMTVLVTGGPRGITAAPRAAIGVASPEQRVRQADLHNRREVTMSPIFALSLVESAPTRELFAHPMHPYTEALLRSAAVPDLTCVAPVPVLSGEVPSPVNIPQGCRFHPRCPKIFAPCSKAEPTLTSQLHKYPRGSSGKGVEDRVLVS